MNTRVATIKYDLQEYIQECFQEEKNSTHQNRALTSKSITEKNTFLLSSDKAFMHYRITDADQKVCHDLFLMCSFSCAERPITKYIFHGYTVRSAQECFLKKSSILLKEGDHHVSASYRLKDREGRFQYLFDDHIKCGFLAPMDVLHVTADTCVIFKKMAYFHEYGINAYEKKNNCFIHSGHQILYRYITKQYLIVKPTLSNALSVYFKEGSHHFECWKWKEGRFVPTDRVMLDKRFDQYQLHEYFYISEDEIITTLSKNEKIQYFAKINFKNRSIVLKECSIFKILQIKLLYDVSVPLFIVQAYCSPKSKLYLLDPVGMNLHFFEEKCEGYLFHSIKAFSNKNVLVPTVGSLSLYDPLKEYKQRIEYDLRAALLPRGVPEVLEDLISAYLEYDIASIGTNMSDFLGKTLGPAQFDPSLTLKTKTLGKNSLTSRMVSFFKEISNKSEEKNNVITQNKKSHACTFFKDGVVPLQLISSNVPDEKNTKKIIKPR